VLRSRLAAVALLPLGVLLGHSAGYGLAGEHTHGYLAGGRLWWAAWLAGAGSVGAFAWFGLRGGGQPRRPRVFGVACAQAVVFVVQEGLEHVLHGEGLADVVASPSFRWGIAAQVVTATILVVTASLARYTAQRLRALVGHSPGRVVARCSTPRPQTAADVQGTVLASPASERGPPSFLAIA
jgi:hypothetical protein